MPANDAAALHSAPSGGDDLPLLIDAARAAGAIALAQWRTDIAVTAKPDGSPVSTADLAVDAALRGALTAARPGNAWLSEETPDDPARLAVRHCFVVDPIDGTRAYLDGQRTWALSLAVVEDGAAVAAVVYLPARALLYAAARGRGATLNGESLRVGTHGLPDGARTLANRATYETPLWRGAVPGFERHFRPSMAYRLALVAQGRFDAMLTLRPAWEWDIAAGSLLVTEAGGRVTDRTGAALRFNTPNRQADGVIAANATLHAGVLAAVN